MEVGCLLQGRDAVSLSPVPYCVHSLIKCPFDKDLGQELLSVLNELEPTGLDRQSDIYIIARYQITMIV